MDRTRYRRLIEQEARHWGNVQPDPQNPQIWHDDRLFDIFFGKEYRHFLQHIAIAGKDVLELGCGEGWLAVELASRGHRVTAIDLSPERIERARKLAQQSALTHRPQFKVGDLNTAKFQKQKFHSVVAHDALHHLYDLDHVLDEVKKTLRPNGRLMTIDYIGLRIFRKVAAAALYALLPTYKSYAEKWGLRKRLGAFLATEAQKRHDLIAGTAGALHHESPFEEISQRSIIEKIQVRFEVVQQFTFCPFWYYLAPKLRLPRSSRYTMAKLFKEMDDELLALGVTGAYVFIEAKKI